MPDLSLDELRALPGVIKELEKLIITCEQISRTNNMSEIKKFAENVLSIGRHHDMTAVTEFASKLQGDLDGFDIVAIKQSLSSYSFLLERLSAYTELEHSRALN